jgi:hypothetical protein
MEIEIGQGLYDRNPNPIKQSKTPVESAEESEPPRVQKRLKLGESLKQCA